MRVCFIGLGSIAVRHIKNLKALLGNKISVSVLRSGKGKEIESSMKPMLDRILTDDAELEKHYDAVFITNPAALHYETLQKYHDLSDAFFIEKPVFLTGWEDLSPFQNDEKIYYTACPLRYMNTIQYLKKHIDFHKVYSMRCISSSYLPDWRPGTDYRDTYSAHKSMGGGVSIDLIHEWDYIYYLTGRPISVRSILSKKSGLETDADDIAVYIAEYADKVVELHLDYFGRNPVRKIELFTEDDTLEADLLRQSVTWMKERKKINLPQDRDDYQKRELEYFLDMVNGRYAGIHMLEEACRVLKIARSNE